MWKHFTLRTLFVHQQYISFDKRSIGIRIVPMYSVARKNKNIYELSFGFFDDEDDRKYALQQLANIRCGASNAAQVSLPAFQASIADEVWEKRDERRLAHNTSQRFKKGDMFPRDFEKTSKIFPITTKKPALILCLYLYSRANVKLSKQFFKWWSKGILMITFFMSLCYAILT